MNQPRCFEVALTYPHSLSSSSHPPPIHGLNPKAKMAAAVSSYSHKFISLFLFLLLHIGCFIFSPSNDRRPLQPQLKKKRKGLELNSLKSFIKRVVSKAKTHFRSNKVSNSHSQTGPSTPLTISSPRSSQHSIIFPNSGPESDFLSDNPFFPLRNDIFPCPACGEIFQKPQMLEQHQSTKHAVTELGDSDSGKNIVWIIFKTGWSDPERTPKVNRILKIHNSPKILTRFEEYREFVKARAALNGAVSKRDERCIADGNELLRFHCTTLACNLGQNGNSSSCNQLYCSLCGIIRSGFSPKLDGICTLSSSWKAHLAVSDDVEAEFAFMNVKRAMLVCRVIAGRVGCEQMVVNKKKEDSGFDSVVGRGSRGKSDDDELLVFNPRAVLPCFVILYSV